MKLNLSNINIKSPYTIWEQDGKYFFKTNFQVIYAVSFDQEEMLEQYNGYWFNLSNTNSLKSPNDIKVSQTVMCIISEFFNSNPKVLLYMCDTANNQQAQRARLFSHWFNKFNKDNRFIFKTAIIKDEEEENYIALIAESSNPNVSEILSLFSQETKMFQENK